MIKSYTEVERTLVLTENRGVIWKHSNLYQIFRCTMEVLQLGRNQKKMYSLGKNEAIIGRLHLVSLAANNLNGAQ